MSEPPALRCPSVNDCLTVWTRRITIFYLPAKCLITFSGFELTNQGQYWRTKISYSHLTRGYYFKGYPVSNLERNLNLFKFRPFHLTQRTNVQLFKDTPRTAEPRWRGLSPPAPSLNASIGGCPAVEACAAGTAPRPLPLFSQNTTTPYPATPPCPRAAPAILT